MFSYVVDTPGFFSTFSRKLNGEKNSIFALSEKTQGHFWPKTQSWGSFYLMNKEEKTQIFVKKLKIWGKNSEFSLKTQHGAACGC